MAEGKAARLFAIVEMLTDHALDGMTNSDIADRLKSSRSNTTRDLAALMEAGWVEKLNNERFVLSPNLVGLLKAYTRSLGDAQERIDRFQHRAEIAARQIVHS